MLPAEHVTGTDPHELDAVTEPLQVGGVGLQPKGPPAGSPANTGAPVGRTETVLLQVLWLVVWTLPFTHSQVTITEIV